MNTQRKSRFFPQPIVWLGVVTWLVLTFFVSRAEILLNNYELLAIVFGIASTSLSMAFVAGWVSLLLTLVVNWFTSSRRLLFRKPLLEWSTFFGFTNALAIWLIFYFDS